MWGLMIRSNQMHPSTRESRSVCVCVCCSMWTINVKKTKKYAGIKMLMALKSVSGLCCNVNVVTLWMGETLRFIYILFNLIKECK